MKPLSFTEAQSWRGLWHVSGSEDPAVPGVLSYDPSSEFTLELFTSLRSPGRPLEGHPGWVVSSGDGHYDVLHGTIDGEPVTLLDCLSLNSKSRVTSTGISLGSEDLSAGTAIFGVEVEHLDEVKFRRAAVSIEGLTSWTGQSALRLTHNPTWTIGEQFPEELSASVPGVHYRLQHSTVGFNPEYRADGTSISVRNEVKLIAETDAPASMRELRDHVANVIDLVSIARRARPQVLAFSLQQVGLAAERFDASALWRQRPAIPRQREDVAFTAAELGFEWLMNKWIDRRSDLISSINLLRATWDDGWYLESSVLALATAIESLASTYDLPLKMDRADYKAMRETVVAAAPAERREWLRSVLAPLNGPSLKTKILAVAERLPERVRDRLVPLDGTWADRLARVRNDLSHSGSSNEDHEVLASLRQVTSAVLYLAILKELGLPDEQVALVMERDGYLAYACTRSRRDLGPHPRTRA